MKLCLFPALKAPLSGANAAQFASHRFGARCLWLMGFAFHGVRLRLFNIPADDGDCHRLLGVVLYRSGMSEPLVGLYDVSHRKGSIGNKMRSNAYQRDNIGCARKACCESIAQFEM